MSNAAETRSGSEGDDYEMVGIGGGAVAVAVCLLLLRKRRVVYSYYPCRCFCRGMLSFCTDVLFLGEEEGREGVRCWKDGGGRDTDLKENPIVGWERRERKRGERVMGRVEPCRGIGMWHHDGLLLSTLLTLLTLLLRLSGKEKLFQECPLRTAEVGIRLPLLLLFLFVSSEDLGRDRERGCLLSCDQGGVCWLVGWMKNDALAFFFFFQEVRRGEERLGKNSCKKEKERKRKETKK